MPIALLILMLWQGPDADSAAEAAVARLGAKRALDVVPTVLDIVGLQAQAIVANVQQVREAMSALKAEESATEISIQLPADVLFDFDKADIRPDAAVALKNLATIIRANPNGRARLEGHTDSAGNEKYNQALSERRAESVRQWLITNEHLDGAKLITKGWGKTKPIASNDTPEGRQKNRRLEAIVEKK
ncbi:MAG TPA: OmpA family protein [Thermoanaerobaculia bacterium]|jgi:outer membrane protein OmpA-like peptidoglycan-associated protein